MPDQDGLRFLFDIQDKITAKLAKIEAKSKASAAKINSAFTKASKAQEANAAKVVHTEKLRGIAVESAAAKATAARTKEAAQGKILAQRLSAAQTAEARRAENFRVASAKRVAKELKLSERKTLTGFKKISGAMHKLGTVGRLALGAFGLAAAKMGEDVQKGLQAVQAGTGATGDKLEELNASFKTVAGSVPQSSALMGAALADLHTLTGATGDVLEDLTVRTADASRLWGGDASQNAKLLGGAMKQWQVPAERGAELIDTLGSVSQQYGVSLDKLLTTTKDYSSVLINAGFSMDESLDLFGRLEGAGISVSRIMPGLNKAFRNWADAGKDSREELALVVDQIHTTTDAQDALSIATEAFGAEGAQRMVTAIRSGQLPSLSDLGVALENTVGALDSADKGSKTFGERLAVLKNKIGAAVPPGALQAFGSVALLMGTLGPLIASINIKTIAMSVASKVATAAQWLLNVAMNANPIGLVIAAIGLLVGAWVLWGDEIKGFMRAVWAKMLDKIGSGLKMLSKFVGIFNDDWAAAMASAGEGLQDTAANMGKAEKATAKLAKKQEATTKATNSGTEATVKATKATVKATKATVKATKATVKATKEQIKAAKAAKNSAEAVQSLLGAWTGATLKSGEFLRAVKKLTPEQKKNDRIMDKVLDKYNSMRKVLGPFNDELEQQWRMTERLNPELAAQRKETEKLEAAAQKLADEALVNLTKEQENLKKAAEDLNGRLEKQRKRLLGLPTDEAIQAFEELKQTWEGLNEAEKAVATKAYSAALRDAAAAGHELNSAQIELGNSAGAAWVDSFFGTLSKAFEGGGGFMGGLKSLASNAFGQIFSSIGGGKGGGFTDALGKMFSGGGVLGKLGAAGSKMGGQVGKFLSIGLNGIPIVGPLIAAFGPQIVKGLMWINKKLLGAIKRLFGGVSAAEKAGRKTAHAFREGVIKGLTDEQRKEVQLSWDEGWDSSVIIAVRDALVATGMDFDAARAAADKWYDDLWKAEKEGPEAVQRVQDAIQAILDAAATGTEDAVDKVATALEAIEALRLAAIEAAEARQEAEMSALKSRQEAELASIDAQIEAVESRLRPKISELEALISQQEAELSALSHPPGVRDGSTRLTPASCAGLNHGLAGRAVVDAQRDAKERAGRDEGGAGGGVERAQGGARGFARRRRGSHPARARG